MQEAISGFQNVEIKIVNIVASVDIRQPLDLKAIVKKFKNAEYSPNKFPGVTYRTKTPKSAILLFRTGKMVCSGTKSREEAHEAVHTAIRELNAQGVEILGEPEITIQNVVASVKGGSPIDLDLLSELLANYMYEPEIFPGLVYRMADPKAVLLLFASGKMVCVGAKSIEIAYEAIEKIYALLGELGAFYQ